MSSHQLSMSFFLSENSVAVSFYIPYSEKDFKDTKKNQNNCDCVAPNNYYMLLVK